MAQKVDETVAEGNLEFSRFGCCGDEDLYPFGCPRCRRLMVFCYECDTLYPELGHLERRGADINHFRPEEPIFACPGCGYQFEYYFMQNPLYRVARSEWVAAGFGALLRKQAP
jgi:hypothetical protein